MAGNKWQISDELSEKITTLIPEHKTNHLLGTNRKRVDDRAAMDVGCYVENQYVSILLLLVHLSL